MNRRDLFKSLAGGLAGALAVPTALARATPWAHNLLGRFFSRTTGLGTVETVTGEAIAFSRLPNVFMGEVDGNWSNPLNWSTGQIPVDGDDVVIPHGALVCRAKIDTKLNSLTIKSGATVGVDPTAECSALTINRTKLVDDDGNQIGYTERWVILDKLKPGTIIELPSREYCFGPIKPDFVADPVVTRIEWSKDA